MRVHVEYADLASVRQIIWCRVNAYRTPDSAQAGFQSGNLANQVAYGLTTG
jgi:hypothetical protein